MCRNYIWVKCLITGSILSVAKILLFKLVMKWKDQYGDRLLQHSSCSSLKTSSDASNHDSNNSHSISSSAYDSYIDVDESAFRVEPLDDNVGMKVVIRTYSFIEGDGASLLLNETILDVVVFYDIKPFFIRSLESIAPEVVQV